MTLRFIVYLTDHTYQCSWYQLPPVDCVLYKALEPLLVCCEWVYGSFRLWSCPYGCVAVTKGQKEMKENKGFRQGKIQCALATQTKTNLFTKIKSDRSK